MILRYEVLEDSFEKCRIETCQTSVDSVLPVLVEKMSSGIWIQTSADEDIACTPAQRRYQSLVDDRPQLLRRVEAKQEDVLGRRRAGYPKDERRNQTGEITP